MKTVYVVVQDNHGEGLGIPAIAFLTSDEANAYVESIGKVSNVGIALKVCEVHIASFGGAQP